MDDSVVSIKFDQNALDAVHEDPGVVSTVWRLGSDVADRANSNAARVLTDQGGGGIGSIVSRIDHDDKGSFANIGPDPAHSYLWFAEFGTSHEAPRPFIRPALYATREGS